MRDPIGHFLNLFRHIAGDTAEAWCGDRKALRKLFKGTAYGQRHKDWFPSDDGRLPSRTMRQQDYGVLRQLLAVTRDRTGATVVSQLALEELDRAHTDYIAAMDAHDARRHRHLTGRTLHLDAARDRVERLLNRNGHSFIQLVDLDFFRYFFCPEVTRLAREGQFHECIRITRAFCELLEKNPSSLQQHETLRHVYAAWCALYGRWAARHSDDKSAEATFIAYLERLHSVFPDHAIKTVLWAYGAARGKLEDGLILCFNSAAHLKESIVWSPEELHPCSLYTDTAVDALKRGILLTQRIEKIGGKTPEQLFIESIESNLDNDSHQGMQCFCLSSYYFSNWLLRYKRLDDALHVIDILKTRIKKIEVSMPYIELCVKESEAQAQKVLWELSKTPSPLIKCVRELEEAARLAESMNLYKRAQRLRELMPN